MSLAKYKMMRRFDETPEPSGATRSPERSRPFDKLRATLSGSRMGRRAAESKKLIFVVQKHHATRLHYDFRLELDGVLKSWAVPKGPSMNPADKRLAMMVEDHPLEYAKFKGVIPEGNYGAGKVEIWDKGWYLPAKILEDKISASGPSQTLQGKASAGKSQWGEVEQDAEKLAKAMIKKGDFKFVLHGKKLKGAFVLVKTPHMGKSAWLLIKKADQHAQ